MRHLDVEQSTFHAQSAWDSWYRFSDRACHYTAQTWEWYCQTVFSTEAMERYEAIGDAIGLMMVCTVSLGMAARVTWEDWRHTDEAQQLAELAVETLEDAKPHVERLAYQAVNLIARPVLNHLGQGAQVLDSTQAQVQAQQASEGGPVLDSAITGGDDLRIDLLADNTDWLADEDAIDIDLRGKEIPELLLIARELGIETSVQDKSGLITLIWEAVG